MRARLLTTALSLFFTGLPALAWTTDECRLPDLKTAGLTAEQAKYICRAAPNFNIDILHKDGRTIVIAGEYLYKWNDGAKQGKRLINSFSFRGVSLFPFAKDDVFETVDPLARRFVSGLENLLFRDNLRTSSNVVAMSTGSFLYFDGEVGQAFEDRKPVGREDLSTFALRTAFSDRPITVSLVRDDYIVQKVADRCGDLNDLASYLKCPLPFRVDSLDESMLTTVSQLLRLFPNRGPLLLLTDAFQATHLSQLAQCRLGFSSQKVTRGLGLWVSKLNYWHRPLGSELIDADLADAPVDCKSLKFK